MVDLTHKTIEDLFFKQIRDITRKTYGEKNSFIKMMIREKPLPVFQLQRMFEDMEQTHMHSGGDHAHVF